MNKVKNSLIRSEKVLLNNIIHLSYSPEEKKKLLKTNNKMILRKLWIVDIKIFKELYRPPYFDDVKLNKNQIKHIKEYKELFLKIYDILN